MVQTSFTGFLSFRYCPAKQVKQENEIIMNRRYGGHVKDVGSAEAYPDPPRGGALKVHLFVEINNK